MYYSAFSLLSLVIFIIVNIRFLKKGRNRAFSGAKACYWDFLLSIMIYIITDILWGILYETKMVSLVFVDTTVYFLVMALSVYLWTEFVVEYLNNKKLFDRFLGYAGRFLYMVIVICLLINLVKPIIFTYGEDGTYYALPVRYVFLGAQVTLFTMAALYTYNETRKLSGTERRHNLMIAISGTVMLFFVAIQIFNPFIPVYTIGVLLATCIVHVFVGEEEEQEKNRLLEDALKRAELANSAKTMFLSNMSHEIRTPINAILGMNEIIRRDSKEKKIIGCADSIQKAGTSLLGIISDILDFSKIEAGKLDIYNEEYATAGMIGDLYNLIGFRGEEKGLELRFDIDPSIPGKLKGDELRIKQVITNLLTNAIKYTEKGSVCLIAKYLGEEDGFARIKYLVSDTGIGIKEEEMDRLFMEFDRLDEQRTRTIEGTGLGLPITASLLKMMGSLLQVESTYNVGSDFYFEIKQEIVDATPIGEDWMNPLNDSRQSDSRILQSFVAPDSHILIVDDTYLNLEVICGLLESTEIKIDTATSGAECIVQFEANDYDLVFLDYRMPRMDGIETLSLLKEKYPEKAASVPIISLTASAVAGERERMLAAGFTDYITKPVILTELIKMLLNYLPQEKIRNSGQEEVAAIASLDGIPDKLMSVPFIDVKEGIEYCGTPEFYLKTLEKFSNEIDEKADELEGYFYGGDIESFTVKIHALKSSSLTMGLTELSGNAKTLELAGKAKDIDAINTNLPQFIEEYRNIKTILLNAIK